MRLSALVLAATLLLLAAPLAHAALDLNHDGLSDFWQAAYPTAGAASADPDGDGYANALEQLAGTNPLSAASRPTAALESDASGNLVQRWSGLAGKRYRIDSTADFITWTLGTSLLTASDSPALVRAANTAAAPRLFWRVTVLDADTDSDGLNDWEEAKLGTSPTLADTDRDGLPDVWEATYGLNPLTDDSAGDPDHDGFTNAQEFAAVTNPVDRSSVPPLPIAFWISQPVAPDESMLITAGNQTADSTIDLACLVDADPGAPATVAPVIANWTTLTAHTSTVRSLTATVPKTWSRGIYAARLRNGSIPGPARLVNAPDPWFIQGDLGDSATPGGFLYVAGTCLEVTGGLGPRAALVHSGMATVAATLTAPERVTTSTGYALRYAIPATLPVGDYELWLHNGCGGPAGWVKFSSFIKTLNTRVAIRQVTAWPATEFDVSKQAGANDDARFTAAFAAAQANGGGRILLPAGTYTLTKRLLVPNHTVIVGAGISNTRIVWSVAPPADPYYSAYNALLMGRNLKFGVPDSATYALEDLTLESSPTFTGNVVARVFNQERGWIKRVSIRNTAPHDPANPDDAPTALYLELVNNTQLEDLVLEGAHSCIRARGGITNLRLVRSTLNWRGNTLWLGSGSHSLIVAGSEFHQLGTSVTNGWASMPNPNPGFFYTAFSNDPFTRDLLWTGNFTTRAESEIPPGYVGFTGDGSHGIYLGKVATASATQLTLAAPIADYTPPNWQPGMIKNFTGGIIQILDGRGAGQWRYLVDAQPKATAIQIDRAWDIAPDSSSTVALVNLLGRLLMVDNDFAQEPLNQDYYLNLDSIKAGNHFGVAGSSDSHVVSRAGGIYGGLQAGWHYQCLGNQVTRGSRTEFWMITEINDSGYPGTVGAAQVYRNNTNTSAGVANLWIGSRDGAIADVLAEHNQFNEIRLTGKWPVPVALTGALLRANKKPDGTATPVTADGSISGVKIE